LRLDLPNPTLSFPQAQLTDSFGTSFASNTKLSYCNINQSKDVFRLHSTNGADIFPHQIEDCLWQSGIQLEVCLQQSGVRKLILEPENEET